MTWQLCTLISVLALSASVIVQRVLMHKDKINPYTYAVVFQGLVGLILLPLALMNGFTLSGVQSVIVPAVASVVLYGVGSIMYAKTLQKVEASSFSVLFATQAVWTMALGAILLQEALTWVQLVGVVLIFASAVLVAKNFKALLKQKGIALGLLTGLVFGVAVYAWSYVGRYLDPLSWAAVSFMATAFVVMAIRPNSLQNTRPLLQPAVLGKVLILALLYGLGSLAMLLAYKYGTFAVVSPLRQTSIVVTVLLALVLLPSERKGISRKILAALVATAGVVLIIL